MTLDQALAFGLIGAAIAFFVWGRFRYDLVALGTLLAGVGIGVVPAKQAFEGFNDDVVVIIAAALVVSAAVSRSGIAEALMRPLLSRVDSERGQIPVLVGATALVSMLTKNVGALAMLMPVAINACRRTGCSPSRVLMPMSFAALLGGLVTLVGTAPNIIVSQVREEIVGEPFGMFDYAPVGLALTAAGVLFLCFAYRILPKDRQGPAQLNAAMAGKTYATEVELPPDTPDGRTVADFKLASRGVTLTALLRHGERVAAPLPDATVKAGDVLMLEGDEPALDEVVATSDLKLTRADRPITREEASEEIRTVEAVIEPGSMLVGRSARRMDLYNQFGVNLLAVGRNGERISERLRNVTLRAGDMLVLQAGERSMAQALKDLGCLPLAEREVRLGGLRRQLAPALLLAAAMIAVALNLAPVAIAFFGAAVLMVASGSLTMREAYHAIDAPVLILVAALVPVSQAIQDTGGAALIGGLLASALEGLPAMLALGLMLTTAMAVTPFLLNAPAVLVLGPIGVALARRLELNPDPFLMAVAIGTACDFLTPIGHQCNTLVLGPGGYRFGDYWKLGAPLSLLVILLGTPLIALVWPLANP